MERQKTCVNSTLALTFKMLKKSIMKKYSSSFDQQLTHGVAQDDCVCIGQTVQWDPVPVSCQPLGVDVVGMHNAILMDISFTKSPIGSLLCFRFRH